MLLCRRVVMNRGLCLFSKQGQFDRCHGNYHVHVAIRIGLSEKKNLTRFPLSENGRERCFESRVVIRGPCVNSGFSVFQGIILAGLSCPQGGVLRLKHSC